MQSPRYPLGFDDFYRSEYSAQRRRAFLLLGNETDADEVVGDAFMSVLTRWGAIDAPGPYLNQCVLNGCRDRGRSRRRSAERLGRGDQLVHHDYTAAVELADLLLTLPFRQRAMIVLRFYGGHTENEIAEALGCRPGSVGPTIHRALTKLRGALQ